MKYTEVEIEEICIESIRNYLNRDLSDEEILKKYRVALSVMCKETEDLLKTKQVGISSVTQGSQSISFDGNTNVFEVSNTVKLLLPKPYLRGY